MQYSSPPPPVLKNTEGIAYFIKVVDLLQIGTEILASVTHTQGLELAIGTDPRGTLQKTLLFHCFSGTGEPGENASLHGKTYPRPRLLRAIDRSAKIQIAFDIRYRSRVVSECVAIRGAFRIPDSLLQLEKLLGEGIEGDGCQDNNSA
jgi:hypothetical protein